MNISDFILWLNETAAPLGYLGVFIVSLVGNATILFPIPAFIFVFTMASMLDPTLVALAGALGASLGEMTGYGIGVGGRAVAISKYKKGIEKAKKWVEKRGMFVVIIFFAATPIPADIIGVLSGIIRYNIKKFLLAMFVGKFILNLIIAWAGFYSLPWVLNYLAFG